MPSQLMFSMRVSQLRLSFSVKNHYARSAETPSIPFLPHNRKNFTLTYKNSFFFCPYDRAIRLLRLYSPRDHGLRLFARNSNIRLVLFNDSSAFAPNNSFAHILSTFLISGVARFKNSIDSYSAANESMVS